jgi:hypothetical protein
MQGPMEIVILYLVMILVWLGLAVFLLALGWRFVKAVERIATALEQRQREGH